MIRRAGPGLRAWKIFSVTGRGGTQANEMLPHAAFLLYPSCNPHLRIPVSAARVSGYGIPFFGPIRELQITGTAAA